MPVPFSPAGFSTAQGCPLLRDGFRIGAESAPLKVWLANCNTPIEIRPDIFRNRQPCCNRRLCFMSNRKITIATQDFQRLKALLASNVARLISRSNCLDELQADLKLAEVVSHVDLPKNVVTMNSTVTLRDLHTQDTETYTLVYPDHADIANRKLSVCAPIGAAVLGYRVGDELQWRVPAGWRRLKVQNVVQSEPDGVFPVSPWCASK